VLTGICREDVVRADVVSLQLKFVDGQQYVPIACAVCDQLSNSLILGADIVDKLQRKDYRIGSLSIFCTRKG